MKIIIRWIERRFRRWDRRLTLSKRQQFVIATGFLTAGLILTQVVAADYRYPMVAGLSVITYILCAFVLREELRGIEWFTLLILPTLFTGATSLFYFLLPARWLTRLPIALLYGVGIYALILTENIYNVAANRTIGLLRAAHSVGFLLTLATYFLLVQTILAFRFIVFVNIALIALVSFPLIIQTLWAMELEERASRRVLQLSGALTFVLVQIAWIFSLWPVKTTLQALFLTTVFYSIVGMAQHYIAEKLYKKTVMEFFIVTVLVFGITMIATTWRGFY